MSFVWLRSYTLHIDTLLFNFHTNLKLRERKGASGGEFVSSSVFGCVVEFVSSSIVGFGANVNRVESMRRICR